MVDTPVDGNTSQPLNAQSQAAMPRPEDNVSDSTVPNAQSEWLDNYTQPLPEQVAYEWTAASRPYKKRSPRYYVTASTIVLLISLILFFAGQFLPIAVVIAVAFLAYVLSAVPPTEANYSLTSYGVRIDGTLYYWEELGRFWIEEVDKQPIIYIEVGRFPNRLAMLIGESDLDNVKNILGRILLEQKPAPTAFDKAADWLQNKFPLDTK